MRKLCAMSGGVAWDQMEGQRSVGEAGATPVTDAPESPSTIVRSAAGPESAPGSGAMSARDLVRWVEAQLGAA